MTDSKQKPIAWVTGAGGLIGNYLVQLAPQCAAGFRIAALNRARLDLANCPAVRKQFGEDKPLLVIHCAALSSSVEGQKNPALAKKLNVDVTAMLAELAANIPFVFFSTDLVFDGKNGNYNESSPTNPLSVYGETKVAAEKIVLANPRHAVVRTSLNGGVSPTGNRAFNEQLVRAWQASQVTKLFTDEFRSPIPAEVTARAVWGLVSKDASGLFHVAGSERLSRYQIGELVAVRHPESHPKIEAESLKNYAGVPRAADTSLDCSKAQKLLSFPLPGLTEWLRQNPDKPF